MNPPWYILLPWFPLLFIIIFLSKRKWVKRKNWYYYARNRFLYFYFLFFFVLLGQTIRCVWPISNRGFHFFSRTHVNTQAHIHTLIHIKKKILCNFLLLFHGAMLLYQLSKTIFEMHKHFRARSSSEHHGYVFPFLNLLICILEGFDGVACLYECRKMK